MEQNLTFDQLPNAVTTLIKEVSELKNLLTEKKQHPQKEAPEKLLTIQEAGEFLNLSVPTIYSKVSRGELPVYKRTKRLYFSSTELMEYLKLGKQKTNLEIEQEALISIKEKGGKNE